MDHHRAEGNVADQPAINTLISTVFDARREDRKSIEKPPEADKVGLAPPTEVITLKLKDDKTVKLSVGDSSPGTQSAVTYVISSDHPKTVVSVAKRDMDDLLRGLNAYRDRHPLTSKEGDIMSVTLSKWKGETEKSPTVELVKQKDGQWAYIKPFHGEAERGDSPVTQNNAPPSGVQALLNDLTNLRANYLSDKENDFAAENVKEDDLSKYNLGKKNDILRIKVDLVEEISKTINLEGKETRTETKTAPVTVEIGIDKKADDKGDKTGKYFARRSNENDIIKVSAQYVDPLLKLLEKPDALRNRHLVRVETGKRIDAINIQKSKELLEFRHPEGKSWELWYDNAELKTDQSTVAGLVTVFTEAHPSMKFLDPKTKESELGLDKPAATVSIWVNGLAAEDKKDEKKDEKKDKKPAAPKLKAQDKPTVKLIFAPREGTDEDVVVKRVVEGEKEPTLIRVPIKVYTGVMQKPIFYRDKSLPRFSPNFGDPGKDVTKLLYRQGDRVTEVTREKGTGPWKIVQPADLKGRDANPETIRGILDGLNDLRASEAHRRQAQG